MKDNPPPMVPYMLVALATVMVVEFPGTMVLLYLIQVVRTVATVTSILDDHHVLTPIALGQM